MAKRLSEKQKKQIISLFKLGNNIEQLSKEFSCTKLTISRNLKTILGEKKYSELIGVNKLNNEEAIKKKEIDIIKNKNHPIDKVDNHNLFINKEIEKSENEYYQDSSFVEITPLHYEIENTLQKDLSSVSIEDIVLPKLVYMIVDKKIELEIKCLKDFPEWDFLPNDDLNRKTIEIFFDLKLAKRSCNKEQKVLKVPNSDVFRIAAPSLIAKGISRIVCAENLIAL